MRLIDEGCDDEPEFRAISLALHRRLGLKPWHSNVFDIDDDAPDNPHLFVSWKHVTSLRQSLIALAQPRVAREESEEHETGATAHAEAPR